MTETILKILDKKVITLDGVKVEVELRMIRNRWKEIVFRTHARFNHQATYPTQILKDKYLLNKKELKGSVSGSKEQ